MTRLLDWSFCNLNEVSSIAMFFSTTRSHELKSVAHSGESSWHLLHNGGAHEAVCSLSLWHSGAILHLQHIRATPRWSFYGRARAYINSRRRECSCAWSVSSSLFLFSFDTTHSKLPQIFPVFSLNVGLHRKLGILCHYMETHHFCLLNSTLLKWLQAWPLGKRFHQLSVASELFNKRHRIQQSSKQNQFHLSALCEHSSKYMVSVCVTFKHLFICSWADSPVTTYFTRASPTTSPALYLCSVFYTLQVTLHYLCPSFATHIRIYIMYWSLRSKWEGK